MAAAIAEEVQVTDLDQDALLTGEGGQAVGIQALRAVHPEAGAAVGGRRAHHRQMALDGVTHQQEATLHHLVHLIDQAVVVAPGDEQPHRTLIVGRRMAQHQAAQGAGLSNQGRVRDHVAQAQTGGEGLGEAADIDDALVAVEALERGCRVVGVVALALVVVLDDQEVAGLGHVQQLAAALQRQGDGRRRLVAGRDIYQAAVLERFQRLHALVVDGQQLDVIGEGAGDVVHVDVAGVLHREALALLEQQHAADPQRLLGAHRDQDFLRACPDAAAGQQPLVDLLDQQRVVIVEVVHRPAANRRHAHRVAAAFAPVLGGEEFRVQLAIEKGVVVLVPVAGLLDGALLRGLEGQPLIPVEAVGLDVIEAHRRVGATLENLGIDEVTAALAGDQKAVFQQLLIGQHHGIARDIQLAGQLATGGQRDITWQMAFENRLGNLLANLELQAFLARGIEVKQRVAHACSLLFSRACRHEDFPAEVSVLYAFSVPDCPAVRRQ